MIGNDIIDLRLAKKESHWQRKGFINKLFTVNEQLLIANATDSEIKVWDLWSRKEAAYKIHNRETQTRAFNPLQFECFEIDTVDHNIFGKVTYFTKVCYTMTNTTTEFIDTVAVFHPNDFVKIRLLDLNISIIKTNGIPNYFDSNSLSLRPLSKSHHGRFEKIVTLFE